MTPIPARFPVTLRVSRGPRLARVAAVAAFGAAVAAASVAFVPPAQAQAAAPASQPGADAKANSPVGLWRNIDDETKQPKALVRITERDGVYYGRIEKILTERTDGVCDLCTDERKGQPIQGMQIIDGMRASSDEPGQYEGGHILDPNNGKVYRSRMRVVDGGERLEVRGYIGAPLFGRTQTWVRER